MDKGGISFSYTAVGKKVKIAFGKMRDDLVNAKNGLFIRVKYD